MPLVRPGLGSSGPPLPPLAQAQGAPSPARGEGGRARLARSRIGPGGQGTASPSHGGLRERGVPKTPGSVGWAFRERPARRFASPLCPLFLPSRPSLGGRLLRACSPATSGNPLVVADGRTLPGQPESVLLRGEFRRGAARPSPDAPVARPSLSPKGGIGEDTGGFRSGDNFLLVPAGSLRRHPGSCAASGAGLASLPGLTC